MAASIVSKLVVVALVMFAAGKFAVRNVAAFVPRLQPQFTRRSTAFVGTKFAPSATRPCWTSSRLFSSPSDDSCEWKVPTSIRIPSEAVDMSFVRSSGAGGQNVNKVNSQVQLRMHLDSASWIPYEVRARLQVNEAPRINKEGYLVIHSQEHRTQTANRQTAFAKLERMILEAWPRPKKRRIKKGLSKKTKEERKEFKRRRSEVKANRRPVDF